jgi:AcrR family transcriptional regulator
MITKNAIQCSAWRCFEKGGEAALSLRRVAADVGLTPMAIYRHFASRQALLDALVMGAIDEWRRVVEAIPPAPPAEWLRAIAAAYLDFALEQPRRFEAAFLVASPVALRYPDDFFAGASPALRRQLALVEELSETGNEAEAASILVTMIAMAQGLVTLHRAGRIAGDEADFRRLFNRATCWYIDSLAPTTAR